MKLTDDGIVPDGGQGCHVENGTHIETATLNMTAALMLTGIVIERCDADQSRDLATRKGSQFR